MRKDGTDKKRTSLLTAVVVAIVAVFNAITRRGRKPVDSNGRPPLPEDRARISPFDETAAGAQGGVKGWIMRQARRRGWGWLGRGLQVHQRYSELRGGDMASAVTLQAFLALFPLAVFGIAIIGYLQAGSDDFADDVIEYFGLTGEGARIVTDALDTAAQSRRVATVVGLLGLLWAGLGFTAALRLAYNQAWQVADRGWRDRLIGLYWFAGAGVLLVAGVSASASVGFLTGDRWPIALAIGLAMGFALFLWTANVLPNLKVGWKPLLPGSIVGAIGLEVLIVVGAYIVPRMIARASALWGTLGVVFAILVWLLVFGRLVVYCAVLDVVLYEADAGTVYAVVEQPRHPGATREVTRGGASRPGSPPADSQPFTPYG